MKRTKTHRFLALLLAVLLFTSILPTAAFALEPGPLESAASQPAAKSVPVESAESAPAAESAPVESAESALTTESVPVESGESAPTAESVPMESGESAPTAESAPVESTESVPAAESVPMESTESAPAAESVPVGNAESAPTTESAPDAVPADSAAAPALSETAAAFIETVGQLDQEAMIAAANRWGLAHLAWLADKENAGLNAALEEALTAQEAAMETANAAEALYTELSVEERSSEEVTAAFGILAAAFAAAENWSQNPIPPDPAEHSPGESELLHILYHDLPDAPTGSYPGSTGLPVATGETKISIAEWAFERSAPSGDSRLDAAALNQDALVMQAEKQAGEDFAIVPIAVQAEYPANGSSCHIGLPDDVVLLSFSSTAEQLTPASSEEAARLLHPTYSEVSAYAQGLYVKATHDFDATLRYDAPDGSFLCKTLHVQVVDGSAASPFGSAGAATYARPSPAQTTGRITKCVRGATTWLIWFNDEEAYCCTHGLKGKPDGCPLYGYTHTSMLEPGQKQDTHEATQISIWGALDQLSLGLLAEQHTDAFADSPYAANAAAYGLADRELAEFCYRYYDDVQMTIIQNYPDSLAAQLYVASAKTAMEARSNPDLLAAAKGYYTYIYAPPIDGWQTVALIGPEVAEEGGEGGGEPSAPEYFADWSVGPQSAKGSFDCRYQVKVNKEHSILPDKIDGAVIEIEPLAKSGTVDGGSWTLTPAAKQTVTTGGHTMDEAFHRNGGKASASWQLHYNVTKTTPDGKSGCVGPYDSQADADEAAAREEERAAEELKAEAQALADAAVAAAKKALMTQQFRFEETVVPVGFEKSSGPSGSRQQIKVRANSSDTYTMHNEEWGAKIAIKKVDSETGSPIRQDAVFELFAWDQVAGKYLPFGGYNEYRIVRRDDGIYAAVREHGGSRSDTVYYSQRNQGKFLIVETKAPAGYYGDWTDVTKPGTPGSPAGKRAYAVQLTKENNRTQILLDNRDYNADIAPANQGGTLLHTAKGDFTVHFHGAKKPAGKQYQTDPTGIAANENRYVMVPQEGLFQNDRVLGTIKLTKNDLEAMRPVQPGEHGAASLEGAVYDLYAAETIRHPDGFTGVVDYSKLLGQDGQPIWHTTILENGGWNDHYLPVLEQGNLVASAAIHAGKLAFANLYPGRYLLVERATGLTLPVDGHGRFCLSGRYPNVNAKLERTGSSSALAQNSRGEYTDYLYKNQFSQVAASRTPDGRKTYDGYYLSFAKGYLCDEKNHYQNLLYHSEAQYLTEASGTSNDAVMKSGFMLNKIASSADGSSGVKLEGAGFTVYRVDALSKASRFVLLPDGKYDLTSILDAYRKGSSSPDAPAYDFSREQEAVARTYENDRRLVDAYNASLTAAGDYANGKGQGWVHTGKANEYRLAELFTNEEGILRVEGLPYGQYLLVETSVPQDVFQAAPFLVTVDGHAPQSRFSVTDGAATVPSNSCMTFNVLDKEMEGYLAVEKIDAETGKPVRLAHTAFALYALDPSGKETPVRMNDPTSGDPHQKTNVFQTDAEGRMKTPEPLPMGKYRLVEVAGPDGFFNDAQFDLVFELTGSQAWETIGGTEYVLRQRYANHETLGKIILRKTGEVLTGFDRGLFSHFTDAARPGTFRYTECPMPGAEFTITAAEDIYTQDRQVDAQGNRTLWYAKGDVVAVVTTGDGSCHQGVFGPTRTVPTRDFCSVIHTSEAGAVSVVLPLGRYHIEETKAPYGHTLSGQSYDVALTWEQQEQELVSAAPVECRNEREKARVGIYKKDARTGKFLAGAVFALHTQDAIYSEDGTRLFAAGELVATSPATNAEGYTFFDADIPVRGEYYGNAGVQIPTESGFSHQTNSGRYTITEVRPPEGYFLNPKPMEVTFTYTGQVVQVLDSTCTNEPAQVRISKRALTGGDELPGASLTVRDEDGQVVREWVSGNEPVTLSGLHFGVVYTLTERAPAPGYALAESIRFKLVQAHDADGKPLDTADVYVAAGKELGFIDRWERLEEGMVIMRDDVTRVQISKKDITNQKELPGAHLVLKDKDGKVIQAWISTDQPHYIEKLPVGEYTLIEESAPAGYVVSEAVRFSVLPTGQLQQVEMVDDVTRVQISKRDITNQKELPGAHLALKDKDGKVIQAWISTDQPHYIEQLPVGEYTLIEESAPAGYVVSEAVHFSVLPTGELQQVEMVDDVTRVQISKKDITNQEELPGAHLILKDKNGKVIQAWISTDQPHYIEKLPVGEYILSEITAPDGYEVAEDIPFKVEETGELQTVVMEDRPAPAPHHTPEAPSQSQPVPPHSPHAPKTGDSHRLPAALACLVGSLLGLAAVYLNHRYSKKSSSTHPKDKP